MSAQHSGVALDGGTGESRNFSFSFHRFEILFFNTLSQTHGIDGTSHYSEHESNNIDSSDLKTLGDPFPYMYRGNRSFWSVEATSKAKDRC
jgi:hypothetical protein